VLCFSEWVTPDPVQTLRSDFVSWELSSPALWAVNRPGQVYLIVVPTIENIEAASRVSHGAVLSSSRSHSADNPLSALDHGIGVRILASQPVIDFHYVSRADSSG
jgi:hypothetical protein